MVGENKIKKAITVLIFLFPCLVGLIVFNIIPILQSAYISFTDWNLISQPKFIGIDNFKQIFSDDYSIRAILNTFKYAVFYVPLVIIISLIFASILDMKLKFVKLYRSLVFIPVLLSWVVVSLLWMWMFNADNGLINYLLSLVGVKGPAWLFNKDTAMVAIVIASLWKDLGYFTIIILSGLQSISEEYYESADIDGAGRIRKFFSITVPLLSPTLFFVGIILTINSLQVFDQMFVMTKGGPYGSTTSIVMEIYNNAFKLSHVGLASAQAWFLVVIILILTLVQNQLQKRWVHYETV
ncbi:MAG: sugar ABC transporter permease [Clostridia bacterium]|nr:sugar ABC transporter permease [Clostridia bacterium]